MTEAPIHYYTWVPIAAKVGMTPGNGRFLRKNGQLLLRWRSFQQRKLDHDGQLNTTPPVEDIGMDLYQVDFSLQRTMTRWITPPVAVSSIPIWSQQSKRMTYTSLPCPSVLETTGFPVVHFVGQHDC